MWHNLSQIEKIETEDGLKPVPNLHGTTGAWKMIIDIFKETGINTRRLFDTTLYSVTLKMIYLNFSIMFG